MVMLEFDTYLNYIPIYTTEVFKLFIESKCKVIATESSVRIKMYYL